MNQIDTTNVYQGPRRTKEKTVMNNTRTEMKNTLERINGRITEAETQKSELEDKMVEITAIEQNKEWKSEKKWEQAQRHLGQY